MKWPHLFKKILLIFFFLAFSNTLQAFDRLISLKPNLTEILFSLGLGDHLVGATTFCDTPPAALKIDRVADYLHPDIEKVIAKKPDLILGSEENSSRREVDFLIQKGYRVVLLQTESLNELKQTLKTLGALLQKESQATTLVQSIDQDLKTFQKIASELKTKKPRVLFVVGHQPTIVAGSKNIFDEAAFYLGLENVATQNRAQYPTYSIEMLIASKPDLILDFSMGDESTEKSRMEILEQWKKYPQIEAVQKNRILFVDMKLMRIAPSITQHWKELADKIQRMLGR
ncbi:MAG: ABC transporter substrate-binding protein [Deltaproteobacteria bacterium]|nr:ABC transporter substrate-binding protein [Deltaproteobacteria bacterium]